jgi:hypothetical protein
MNMDTLSECIAVFWDAFLEGTTPISAFPVWMSDAGISVKKLGVIAFELSKNFDNACLASRIAFALQYDRMDIWDLIREIKKAKKREWRFMSKGIEGGFLYGFSDGSELELSYDGDISVRLHTEHDAIYSRASGVRRGFKHMCERFAGKRYSDFVIEYNEEYIFCQGLDRMEGANIDTFCFDVKHTLVGWHVE